MRKTTLYIEDELFMKLKELTIKAPQSSLTRLINEALRRYLDEHSAKTARFELLREARGSAHNWADSQDPLAIQNRLREEW